MAIDPPYRLDPFQNIVNVHWSGTGTYSLGWSALFHWTQGHYVVVDGNSYLVDGWVWIIDVNWDDPATYPAYYAAINALRDLGGTGASVNYKYDTKSDCLAAATNSQDDPNTEPLGSFAFIHLLKISENDYVIAPYFTNDLTA